MSTALFLFVSPLLYLGSNGLSSNQITKLVVPKQNRVTTAVQPKSNLTHISVDPPEEEGGTAIITINGDIEDGDDKMFRDIAAKYSDAYVFLNSDGGALIPAIDIGRTIKLREYTTAILGEGVCASACALIWLAGTHRAIFDGGQVGFHASYRNVDGTLVETGVGNALVGYYLSQLGMGQKAVVFATTAPPDTILWLDDETVGESGITYSKFPMAKSSDEKESDKAPGIETAETKNGSVSDDSNKSATNEKLCRAVDDEVSSYQRNLPVKIDTITSIIGVAYSCNTRIFYVNLLVDAGRVSVDSDWLSETNKLLDQMFCSDAGFLQTYRGWHLTQNMTFLSGERITRTAYCN